MDSQTDPRLAKTGFATSMAAGAGGMGGMGGNPMSFRRSPRYMQTYSHAQLKFQPSPFATQPGRRVPATAAGVQQVKQAGLGEFATAFFSGAIEAGHQIGDFPALIKRAGALVGPEVEQELAAEFQKLAGGPFDVVKGLGTKALGQVPKAWNAAKSYMPSMSKAVPAANTARRTFGQAAKDTVATGAATGTLAAGTHWANDPNASAGDLAKTFAGGAATGGAVAAGNRNAGAWVRRNAAQADAAGGIGAAAGAAQDTYDQWSGAGKRVSLQKDPVTGALTQVPAEQASRTGFNAGLGAFAGMKVLPAIKNRVWGAASQVPGGTEALNTAGNVVDDVAARARSGWSTLRNGLGIGAAAAGTGAGIAVARDPSVIPAASERAARGAAEVLKDPISNRVADRVMAAPEMRGIMDMAGRFSQPLQNMGQFWQGNKDWLAPMLMQGLIGGAGGYMAGGRQGMMAGMVGLPALVQGMQYMDPNSFGDPRIIGALQRNGLLGGEQATIDKTQKDLTDQAMAMGE